MKNEKNEKEAEQIKSQFVGPASATFGVWLIKVIIDGIIWSAAGFFTKIGLNRLFKNLDK